MNYYQRHIGDYHKKAGRLSMIEHGAYTLLLDACYDREKFPTKEEAIDWCWARSAEEIAAVEFVLSKFFTLDGSVYVQTTIKENVAHYHEKALKNKQIAIEREEARRIKREQAVHDGARNVHESPPNHKPITNNQEPITISKDKEHVDSVESPSVDFQEIEFNRFWKYYPTKKAKSAALSAFKRLTKGKKESQIRFYVDLILNYHLDCIERKEIGAEQLHAATLINQKRWEDNPDFYNNFKAEWIAKNANA